MKLSFDNLHKLNCYSIHWFNALMNAEDILHTGSNLPEDIAIISICEPYDNRGEDYPDHWFDCNNDRILNVDFDDIDADAYYWEGFYRTEPENFIVYKGQLLKQITDTQADEIVKFIINNIGKKFIVHCYAGVSRSKAVIKFIFDTFEEYTKDDCYEWSDPEIPNKYVYKKIKEAYERYRTKNV